MARDLHVAPVAKIVRFALGKDGLGCKNTSSAGTLATIRLFSPGECHVEGSWIHAEIDALAVFDERGRLRRVNGNPSFLRRFTSFVLNIVPRQLSVPQ